MIYYELNAPRMLGGGAWARRPEPRQASRGAGFAGPSPAPFPAPLAPPVERGKGLFIREGDFVKSLRSGLCKVTQIWGQSRDEHLRGVAREVHCLCILVYLVIYDSG